MFLFSFIVALTAPERKPIVGDWTCRVLGGKHAPSGDVRYKSNGEVTERGNGYAITGTYTLHEDLVVETFTDANKNARFRITHRTGSSFTSEKLGSKAHATEVCRRRR